VTSPVKGLISDNQLCDEKLIANVRQEADNRLVVAIPFKEPRAGPGESFQIAQQRFLSLERKRIRYPEEYNTIQHLEEMPDKEIHVVKYIMPHHTVIRPESLSTKLCVVFSCKISMMCD